MISHTNTMCTLQNLIWYLFSIRLYANKTTLKSWNQVDVSKTIFKLLTIIILVVFYYCKLL